MVHAKAKSSAKEPASDDAAANTRSKVALVKVPKPLKAKQAGTQQGEELQEPAQQQPKASAQPPAWSKDFAKGSVAAARLSGAPKWPPPAQVCLLWTDQLDSASGDVNSLHMTFVLAHMGCHRRRKLTAWACRLRPTQPGCRLLKLPG